MRLPPKVLCFRTLCVYAFRYGWRCRRSEGLTRALLLLRQTRVPVATVNWASLPLTGSRLILFLFLWRAIVPGVRAILRLVSTNCPTHREALRSQLHWFGAPHTAPHGTSERKLLKRAVAAPPSDFELYSRGATNRLNAPFYEPGSARCAATACRDRERVGGGVFASGFRGGKTQAFGLRGE